MEVTITIKATSEIEKAAYKRNLQAIADNLTKDNLKFIGELSMKPKINEKLESKKGLIKSFI